MDTIERCYLEASAALVQLDDLGVAGSETDIYGCKYEVDNAEFVKCNICERSIICSKYAPHLEKCMGMYLRFLGKKNGQLKSNVASNQMAFAKKKSNNANLLVEPSASGKFSP